MNYSTTARARWVEFAWHPLGQLSLMQDGRLRPWRAPCQRQYKECGKRRKRDQCPGIVYGVDKSHFVDERSQHGLLLGVEHC